MSKKIWSRADYGIPRFFQEWDTRDVSYACAVACDFGVRLLSEMHLAEVQQAEYAQRTPRKRGQPKKPRPAPRHDAQKITGAQAEEAWQTVEWREGSRGTLRQQFVAILVHAGTGCARHSESHGRSWTGPEGWLLGERPVPGEDGDLKWFFSTLPIETSLSRLVELAHLRWPIEQFYEDAQSGNVVSITFKDAVGMAYIGIWRWSCSPTPSSCSSPWARDST